MKLDYQFPSLGTSLILTLLAVLAANAVDFDNKPVLLHEKAAQVSILCTATPQTSPVYILRTTPASWYDAKSRHLYQYGECISL